MSFKNIVLNNNLQHRPRSFFVLFASSMSDETLDITSTGSKDATINLLKFYPCCCVLWPTTSMAMTMIVHLRVVRLATAILRQKQNVASKFCYSMTKAECGIKVLTFEEKLWERRCAANLQVLKRKTRVHIHKRASRTLRTV